MNETIEIKEPVEAVETVKPYTFRRLEAADVFPMATIIKKIGIREFKAFFEGDGLETIMASFKGERDGKGVEALGLSIALEIVDIIFGNLAKCEKDIYQLLAQTSDLEIEDVRGLDLAVFAEMIVDFVKKEEFKDFIKVVSKLFK